ncbi:MAG: tRNA (adenosine(37)-N6)-threonylcarbamoyltransferase complex ATPase subunit type 1 TsaE [Chloroflexi bacterium]|nr:tRNA (adenosine(37)-N6)-threonylcarbamoyltransferase complex ATPase subunit type 1 TsaE [Chloroflexota bacterium]
MKRLDVTTSSPEETRTFGTALARLLQPGAVILLSGELGTGKTTLTQGLARGLGVHADVNSPTFVIAHEFKGRLPLYHLDFYRFTEDGNLDVLGFAEYFWGEGVTVAEWPERVTDLPPEHLSVHITQQGDNQRAFSCAAHGTRYEELLDTLKEELGDAA